MLLTRSVMKLPRCSEKTCFMKESSFLSSSQLMDYGSGFSSLLGSWNSSARLLSL